MLKFTVKYETAKLIIVGRYFATVNVIDVQYKKKEGFYGCYYEQKRRFYSYCTIWGV